MKPNTKSILYFLAGVLTFFLIALLFPLRAKPSEGPQIVLEYFTTLADGTQVFIPKSIVAVGLTPLTNGAQLNKGDISICRMNTTHVGVRSVDGLKAGEMDDIGFRCGENKYLFKNLITKGEK